MKIYNYIVISNTKYIIMLNVIQCKNHTENLQGLIICIVIYLVQYIYIHAGFNQDRNPNG